ncbi:Sgf73p [Sugiyamaella lignohabitans]|uniref:Sgf73p n=1 Tax=Sugiyamaella lignohabitans TaxID=796027 RepID=A0A161HH57_9ASCO|nr:Sgf73p [Sugiyamaella lignohabitans]ANB15240.1 Sgf73p [Sugiyamaella lignohabitans]
MSSTNAVTVSSNASEADRLLLDKAFASSVDASQIVIRVKKPAVPPTSATPSTVWQDYALSLEKQDSDRLHKIRLKKASDSTATNSSRPRINLWDRRNLSPVNLLTSKLDYVLCAHCSKPLLTEALQYHVEFTCPKVNRKSSSNISEAEISEVKLNGTTKKRKWDDTMSSTSSPHPEDPTQSLNGEVTPKKVKKKYVKKQKLGHGSVSNGNGGDDSLGYSMDSPSAEGTPEKKARKSKREKLVKSSASKSKGPVDVERQCGVELPNGGLCARSLTCKTHSMGAKRAVKGRSAPYDILLAQYQRKNQVKMASLSTAQQLADENEALGGSTPLNPDEEVQQVMEGVQRAYPIPLERGVIFPTNLKSKFFRMREMLANALIPKGSPPGLGRIMGRASAFNPESPTTLHFVRPPALQRTAYLASIRQQQLLQQQQQKLASGSQLQAQQNMVSAVAPSSRQASPSK